MPSTPAPKILYRIESLELVSCLELCDVDNIDVALRPTRDDHHDGQANHQHWRFVPSPSHKNDGSFMLLNAATENLYDPRYLDISPPNPTPTAIALTKTNSPASWRFKREEKQEEIFSIIGINESRTDYNMFLLVSPENGRIGFSEEVPLNKNILPRKMKWRITEVRPSVRDDTYRIRTWFGRALHAQSGSDNVSAEPLEKKQHEEWKVQALGNGRCTIQSISVGSYLGWETGGDGITKVVKTKSPQQWIVRSINRYMYTITTSGKPLIKKYEFALTNGDSISEVCLKPIKVTQNQIWFFEAANFVSKDNSDDPGKSNPGKPGDSDTTTRYPEIKENTWYQIRNGAHDSYGRERSISWLWPIPELRALILSFPQGAKFQLKYPGTGGAFILTNAENHVVVRSGNLVKFETENASRWVLERVELPGASSPNYFICAADDHQSVLSADTQKLTHGDTVRDDILTMARKQKATSEKTSLMQMWAFSLANL